MKYINFIIKLINDIERDKVENATYEIDNNLRVKRLNKNEMLKVGNFIYGIQKEGIKEILLDMIFFLENNLGIEKIHLGKGKNPKDNKIIIEIVKFGNDKKEVIELAKKHKQFSIYNIKEDKEIILQYEESKEGEN